MIRRHAISALAVAALGLLVAAPAEAGGTSGAVGVKKNANVIVKNTTTSQWYVVVLPQSLATSTKFGKPNTVGYAKNLGAAIVNPGSTLVYPVPAGAGQIGIIDPAIVPKDLNALIPVPGTGQGTTAAYTVDKGKSVTKTIAAGPVIK